MSKKNGTFQNIKQKIKLSFFIKIGLLGAVLFYFFTMGQQNRDYANQQVNIPKTPDDLMLIKKIYTKHKNASELHLEGKPNKPQKIVVQTVPKTAPEPMPTADKAITKKEEEMYEKAIFDPSNTLSSRANATYVDYGDMKFNTNLIALDYKGTFFLKNGEYLSTNLEKWAMAVGWTLIYDAPKDLVIRKDVILETTFQGGLDFVATNILPDDMHVEVFTGNKVVVIKQGVAKQ